MDGGNLLSIYGALRRPEAQLDAFGRRLGGGEDVLAGHTVEYAEVDETRGASRSGASVQAVLRPTGDPLDKVVGIVAEVSDEELDACDEYEVAAFRRVRVELASGKAAWAYVGD